jgi:hypothetical protein
VSTAIFHLHSWLLPPLSAKNLTQSHNRNRTAVIWHKYDDLKRTAVLEENMVTLRKTEIFERNMATLRNTEIFERNMATFFYLAIAFVQELTWLSLRQLIYLHKQKKAIDESPLHMKK